MRETLGDEQRTGDLTVTGTVAANSVATTEDLLSDAVLWLDAAYSGGGQTIRNLGRGGRALDAQNGSTSGADSNDARFLDWPGDNAGNYVYLPGVSGNYLSVPDEAALDITGDIDIRVRVALDDWTPSSPNSLVSKYGSTAATRSWLLDVRSSPAGNLRLDWNESDTTARNAVSTAAVSAADGEAIWVRATLDVDNGSGEYEVKFYTSGDGSTWSQLGSTITGSTGTTSVQATTAIVNVGSYANNLGSGTAKFYRAQVLDGIDGTTVLDVDTSLVASGSDTSFTARTGQTVTINRSTSGRKSVAVVSPVWLFGTDDFMQVADNALLQMSATQSFTLQVIVRQWGTPVNFGTYIAKHTAGGTNPGYYIRSYQTNVQANSSIDDGPNSAGNLSAVVSAGSLTLFSMVIDRSTQEHRLLDNANQELPAADISSVGSPDIVGPLRIGATSNGLLYQDFELLGVAIFRRALSASEVASISSYYENRVA